MASFIRQLNMCKLFLLLSEYFHFLKHYFLSHTDGFRKVNSIDHGSLKNEKEDMEFHHPYFIKDKEQFLEYIKRKVSKFLDWKTKFVVEFFFLNFSQKRFPTLKQLRQIM